jgi:hypothetical protein
MIKDRPQKERLYRHFRAQGWFAQIEVPVVVSRGVAQRTPLITDIDVLGIRPSPELRWRYIIGDCKTRKKESPVNRVLWASGLMEAFGATSAVVLLKREGTNRIERDHKLFADDRGVLLIEDVEFRDYDHAVLHPTGSDDFPESIDTIDNLRDGLAQQFPPLRDYLRFLLSEAWATTEHATLLRVLLGKAREVRGELNPARDDHFAIILETAASFAVPFASLVGAIFRRHLEPNDRSDLDEAARVIIWGGREQYEFYNRMRAELVAAKGGRFPEPLSLPEWDKFLELLRATLETPIYAFRVPQLLRSISMGVAVGEPTTALEATSDRMLLHVAMRLALYVARATGLPTDAMDRISELFTRRISEIATSSVVRALSVDPQLRLMDGDDEQ